MTGGSAEPSPHTARPLFPRSPGQREQIPLSPLQQQLWFLDRLTPGGIAYNVSRVYRLTGPLDLPALQAAVTEVVRRHESLRTRFTAGANGPWQVIQPEVDDRIRYEDLRHLPAAERQVAAQELLTLQTGRPFDLAAGPLLRLLAVRLGEDTHLFAICAHHICVDGRSLMVIFREIAAGYTAYLAGEPPRLPEPVQFPDVVAWQQEQMQGTNFSRDVAYWSERLRGLEPLALPTDRPRPSVPSYQSGAADRVLPAGLRAALRELADAQSVTMLMLLTSAFTAVLARYTGQGEIVVGTATAGRGSPGLGSVVGPLMNMLVLRNDLSGDPEFCELLARTKQTILGAWARRNVPFEKVVAAVAPQRDTSRNPLFQVALQLLDASHEVRLELPGVTAERVSGAVSGHQFDLTLTASEMADGLVLRVEFAADLFAAGRVERLLGHLERVLAGVVADPGLRVSQLPLVSGAERELLAAGWQGAVVAEPADPVHVQVAAVAAREPGLVAARLGGAQLSFGELDRRAGLVAAWLAGAGVVREDVVAVTLERGPDLLVALVGVLKAGAAFVVLDPSHPARRLEFVLADTGAKVVIGSEQVLAGLPGGGWKPLCLRREWPGLEAAGVPRRWQERADAGSLAYVLYTSGSTGRPKGVLVEHHALTTFLVWLRGVFGLGPGDRMLHHMALIFDFAVGEIFTALVSGATLVFVPEQRRADPAAVGELLTRQRITYLGGPPTMLAAIPRRGDPEYPDLKYVLAGGEAPGADLASRWTAAPWRRFINGYGPTEAAVGCIFYEVDRRDRAAAPPIGRAMPNRRAYVLDQWDNLCPVGVPGEIAVGGHGLARGYHNLPELTARHFTSDPVWPGGRIYRTGDLGAWTEDGQIRFLGRIDDQVKVNGLRIELGEIESVLTDHPAVSAAAVAVTGEAAGQRLVGYLVPAAGQDIDTGAVQGFLAQRLPRYMIPAQYQVIGQLPLTSVGKIDRPRLPAPALAPARHEPPRTPTEQQIAAIFTEVLGHHPVSRQDNFFALGGTSLQAARAVLDIRNHTGADLSLSALYSHPVVAQIADIIGTSAGPPQHAARPAAARVTPMTGPLPPRAPHRHAEILLTGGTGFFGTFLLAELLGQTTGRVHCLVRAETQDQARQRLEQNLARYGRPGTDLRRVAIVLGDLGADRWGLRSDAFARLAREIDTIVHAGARVDLLFPYGGLERANVGGTRTAVDLAGTEQLKELHFVSSVSARLGPYLDPDAFGYAVSKWRAERVLLQARERGIPVALYRIPRLSGDSRTARSNERDIIIRLLKRFSEMQAAPDLDLTERWIPVDVAARLLVATLIEHEEGGRFELRPETQVRIRDLLALAAAHNPITISPLDDFFAAIARRFPEDREVMQTILGTSPAAPPPAARGGDDGFTVVAAESPGRDLLRRYLAELLR